jgi:hypothetical protein
MIFVKCCEKTCPWKKFIRVAYQLLDHGRWFSPGTPASSTTKTGRHDIAEILLKVPLSTINQMNRIDLKVTLFLSCHG